MDSVVFYHTVRKQIITIYSSTIIGLNYPASKKGKISIKND